MKCTLNCSILAFVSCLALQSPKKKTKTKTKQNKKEKKKNVLQSSLASEASGFKMRQQCEAHMVDIVEFLSIFVTK